MLYLGGGDGGGGINSTAASHAFVTDTWFMQANGKVLYWVPIIPYERYIPTLPQVGGT